MQNSDGSVTRRKSRFRKDKPRTNALVKKKRMRRVPGLSYRSVYGLCNRYKSICDRKYRHRYPVTVWLSIISRHSGVVRHPGLVRFEFLFLPPPLNVRKPGPQCRLVIVRELHSVFSSFLRRFLTRKRVPRTKRSDRAKGVEKADGVSGRNSENASSEPDVATDGRRHTLDERRSESGARRGRPRSAPKGQNGFGRKTRAAERRSGWYRTNDDLKKSRHCRDYSGARRSDRRRIRTGEIP